MREQDFTGLLINKEYSFWYREEDKAKSLIDSFILSKETYEYVKNTLIPMLDSIYPNNWDIHLEGKVGQDLTRKPTERDAIFTTPMLYFLPKVTIKFSNLVVEAEGYDIKHKMRDIFFNFCIEVTAFGIDISRVTGYRTTLTNLEYNNGYNFSHLSGGSFNEGHYCLGSGFLSQAVSVMRGAKDETWMKMFLMGIVDYLQWESKEGGPYKFLKELFVVKKATPVYRMKSNISSFLEQSMSEELLSLLHLKYSYSRIQVDRTEEFQVFAEEFYKVFDREAFAYLLPSGEEIDHDAYLRLISGISEDKIKVCPRLFRGKFVPLRLIEQEDNYKELITLKLKKDAVEQLYIYISKHLKEKSTKIFINNRYQNTSYYEC